MIRTRLLRTMAAIALAASTAMSAEFSLCSFNFGVDWGQHISKHCNYYRPNCSDVSELQIPDNISFIATFVGWTQDGSTKVPPTPYNDKEGKMLADAKKLGVTPVWYTYIIAEGAKLASNLTDCNMGGGSGTLCTGGAAYIKSKRSTILDQYKAYAAFAAKNWGTSKPMIWALEPDFVQYTDGSQSSPLSMSDAKSLISDIIDVIQGQMPNAWISMDISPWKNQSEVIPAMVPLTKVKFMNTSGGISLPGGNIKNGEAKWSDVWSASSGKGMIADDGYGTGGSATNPNAAWSDVSNLKARINDGVVALMEALPGSSWGSTVANLNTQLAGSKLKTCSGDTPVKPTYKLTVTTPVNGTITLSPAGGTYDSGASVTVTAKASTGYSFSAWTGASTATTSPVTIVMTKDMTIGANFSSSTKPKYKLTVTAPTNGTITLSPAGGTYDSGTTVTASATAIGNYKFSAWTGASTTTTSPVSILMTGDKTLGATFVADNSPVKVVVSASNGTVALSPAMPAAGYARGTSVTLTVTPAAGYDFIGWAGDASGSTNPLVLVVDAAKNITANFRKQGSVTAVLSGGDCSDGTKWTGWGVNNNGWQIKTQEEPENTSNKVCYAKDNNYQALPDTTLKMSQSGFQLVKGTTYFLAFRARVEKKDDVRGAHPIGVRIMAGGAQVFKKSDSVPQDSGVWHLYRYEFTPTSGGSAQFDFLLGGSNQLSWQGLYLDDIYLADAPLAVERRTVRASSNAGVAARFANGVLNVRVSKEGRASMMLLSPSGELAADLGSYRLDGAELSVHLDRRLSGLKLLMVRGDGWQSIAPVVLKN